MSMKTRDEKEKKRDLFTTIFWILVLVFLIVKIVIPETGVLGMEVKEFLVGIHIYPRKQEK